MSKSKEPSYIPPFTVTAKAIGLIAEISAHGVMMNSLTEDAGRFRQSGVGVFAGEKCVHMVPPAQRVPFLISEPFDWLKYSKDHLLIRSCVFHYEFEFIHPFSDGNGRMGRLWQSLILGKLHPVFEHLPIENMVYSNQQKYYDAITESTKYADSWPFIDFMLNEILNTLKKYQDIKSENKVPNKIPNKTVKQHPEFSGTTWDVLSQIINNPKVTSSEMSFYLGISDRMIRKHVKILRDNNVIERVGGNKGGHWKVL